MAQGLEFVCLDCGTTATETGAASEGRGWLDCWCLPVIQHCLGSWWNHHRRKSIVSPTWWTADPVVATLMFA